MERDRIKSYRNFNVSVYTPVGDVNRIEDLEEFDRLFRHIEKNIRVGRVYIENYRGGEWATDEQLLKVKQYFENKGIAVSGGLTPTAPDSDGSLCYSKEENCELLKKAVEQNARLFDEMIFDDFFFLNCKCPDCVKKRGKRNWTEFRLKEKERLIKDYVMGPAHKINPRVNVILKYPQWFEVFNELGYDLGMEPSLFDSIYTGTETRNPKYCSQHLPKYLSYYTMRLYESAAPGRNLGGWFDPYACTYNLTSYLEQGYLTLFGKAREAMLFCMGSLLPGLRPGNTDYRLFAPAVGEMFAETDEYIGKLGNPVGIPAYYPHNSRGEENIHSYLGTIGFPTEPVMNYPEKAKIVFLAEGAVMDPGLDEKMEHTLQNGGTVIMTSNLVRRMGIERMRQFSYIDVTPRKAMVQEYGVSNIPNVLGIGGVYKGRTPVLISQIDIGCNDVGVEAVAWGEDNCFPMVASTRYGNGKLVVLNIPDNFGDLYNLPQEVLYSIRKYEKAVTDYVIDAPSRVQVFVYDNDKVIIRSDFENACTVGLEVPEGKEKATDLVSGKVYPVIDGKVTLQIQTGVNYVMDIQ